MTRALVIAAGFVPSDSVGGGVILHDLLCDVPAERIGVVAASPVVAELRRRGSSIVGGELVEVHPPGMRLPGPLRRFATALRVPLTFRAAMAMTSSSSTVLAVPWRGQLGPEIFVGAVLTARRRRAKLVVYEMDEWLPSGRPGVGTIDGLLERLFHRMALHQADHVWTVSHELAGRLRDRFGVEAAVMPSAVDLSGAEAAAAPSDTGRPATLVFTGALYGAQADALRRIAAVIRSRPDLGRLEIYTDASESDVASFGIDLTDNVVLHDAVPRHEVAALLADADVLVLPFAFNASQRDVVSGSFPTKVADYLASGTPILVHAPAYSTVTRAANADGWGLVVDEADNSAVEKAIDELVSDVALRQRLVERARSTAHRDHDLAVRRREVAAVLFGADPAS